MADQKTIKTRSAETFLGEDGIVRVKMLPVDMTLADAVEGTKAHNEAFDLERKRRPVFCDYTNIRSMPRECRQYYAGEETARIHTACAILTGSNMGRLIANFFMGLNTPVIPTRLFNDEAKAIDWLKTHIED